MGATCCNYQPKDANGLNFKDGKKPVNQKADKEMEELLKHAEANQDQIVKIQAGFRGAQARKKNKKKGDHSNSVKKKHSSKGSKRESVAKEPQFRLLTEMPDVQNAATKETEKNLGKFAYD
jgi:hypothetical protein